jgi:nitrogenase molybdenum-iron protein alpha chain
MDLTLNNPCWKMIKAPWDKQEAEAEKKAA